MLKTGIALFKMPLAHSPGRFVNFSLRLVKAGAALEHLGAGDVKDVGVSDGHWLVGLRVDAGACR